MPAGRAPSVVRANNHWRLDTRAPGLLHGLSSSSPTISAALRFLFPASLPAACLRHMSQFWEARRASCRTKSVAYKPPISVAKTRAAQTLHAEAGRPPPPRSRLRMLDLESAASTSRCSTPLRTPNIEFCDACFPHSSRTGAHNLSILFSKGMRVGRSKVVRRSKRRRTTPGWRQQDSGSTTERRRGNDGSGDGPTVHRRQTDGGATTRWRRGAPKIRPSLGCSLRFSLAKLDLSFLASPAATPPSPRCRSVVAPSSSPCRPPAVFRRHPVVTLLPPHRHPSTKLHRPFVMYPVKMLDISLAVSHMSTRN